MAAGCGILGKSADESASDGQDNSDEKPVLSGSLSTRYRARWNSAADDHDVYTILSLDAGDPHGDSLSGSLMGRLAWDVDGPPSADGEDPFRSLDDRYEGEVQGQLYFAYVDVGALESLERARIGRQQIYETPEFAWFDGVFVEYGGERIGAAIYGGVPVHAHESSSAGDLLIGSYLHANPWSGGRARLDWMHIEDARGTEEFESDLWGLSLQQRLGARVRLEAEHTNVDGEARDLRIGAHWISAEADITAFASYYELLHTQSNLALELDPFFAAMHQSFPFRQARLLLAKDCGASLRVETGFDIRRVDDRSDIGEFNRDYERTFLTTIFPEALPGATTLSLTGDAWQSGGFDTHSLGMDFSRQMDASLELSTGSYYSLFKYDLYQDREREEVRTYYLRGRYRSSDSMRLELRYELEQDSLDTYHTVRLVTTWQF